MSGDIEWRPSEIQGIDKVSLQGLKFHRNAEKKWHCPVTLKEFNKSSRIVAIRSTGNVFSYDAIKKLNIDTRQWFDPLTNEEYQGKEEILELQNPAAVQLPSADVSGSQSGVMTNQVNSSQQKKTDSNEDIRMSSMAKKIMDEARKVGEKRSLQTMQSKEKLTSDTSSGGIKSRFSSGLCAASFTSTAVTPVTTNALADASEDEIREMRAKRFRAAKETGVVKIRTNYGTLGFEIFVGHSPMAAENFLTLASSGKYNSTIFHRLIPGFMIQGGDPTGTGKGGESIWGKTFKDEFPTDGNPMLKHSKRGVLSMANRGPNTNGSQFFITFKPCPHLDKKHTVFGRMVAGFEVLDELEKVSVGSGDRPISPVRIEDVIVLANPFTKEDSGETMKKGDGNTSPENDVFLEPILPSLAQNAKPRRSNPVQIKNKAPTKTQFSNFDAW